VKAKKPRCETCKTTANVHARPQPGQLEGAHGALRWLCGDCEYAELHDDFVEAVREPRRKREPQAENLFP